MSEGFQEETVINYFQCAHSKLRHELYDEMCPVNQNLTNTLDVMILVQSFWYQDLIFSPPERDDKW